MIDIRAIIEPAIKYIEEVNEKKEAAVMRGLVRAGRGIYDIASDLLNGPKRTPVKTHGSWKWRATGYQREGATRSRGQHSFLGARPGSYPPVPKLTGHLHESLAILEPGESKKADFGTVRAGKDEVIIFNSAAYGGVIHEGEGTSKKHGRRPFLDDAVQTYETGGGIAADVEDELSRVFGR